ncbi:hypothetical protein CMK15_02465 [Candidatus Poribacteria bacterium]|nr:hypothetical protein [Candidatus Poribacteria bacterium]
MVILKINPPFLKMFPFPKETSPYKTGFLSNKKANIGCPVVIVSLQEHNKRETKMRIIPSNKPFNSSLILLVALTTLLMTCGDDDDVEQDKIYTGKLVIQGVCMHYVIQVNDTDFPQELIEKNWIHEASGIKYENVFSLRGNGGTSESVCDFPEDIKEGDSFKFMIGHKKRLTSLFNEYAVCDAYSQVPKKYLSITVI